MAKFENGILGKLSGKLGNVVLSSWKGIPYIRSMPAENTSNTPAQQKQRTKFSLVVAFVNSIHPVINAGFKYNTEQMTEMNSATSYLMKRSIKMDEKGLPRLHFPWVMVARGMLGEPLNAAAERTAESIKFTWTFDEAQPAARADDKIIVLAYIPAFEQAYERLSEVTSHSLCRPVPGAGDQPLELYLAFAAADGNDACDSVYLGTV